MFSEDGPEDLDVLADALDDRQGYGVRCDAYALPPDDDHPDGAVQVTVSMGENILSGSGLTEDQLDRHQDAVEAAFQEHFPGCEIRVPDTWEWADVSFPVVTDPARATDHLLVEDVNPRGRNGSTRPTPARSGPRACTTPSGTGCTPPWPQPARTSRWTSPASTDADTTRRPCLPPARDSAAHVWCMAHETAQVELDCDTVARIRTEVAEANLARSRTAGHRPRTPVRFEDEMIRAALTRWRDEDAGPYDDPRTGDGYVTAPMTGRQAQEHINANLDRVAADTVIIPLVDDTDAVTTVRRVTVLATPAESALAWAARDQASWQSMPWELRGRITRQACPHGDGTVTAVAVVSAPKPARPHAGAGAGRTRTVYQVVRTVGGFRDVPQGTYDTIAKARAAATQAMTDDPAVASLRVVGHVVRDTTDGTTTDTLVTVTRPSLRRDTITVDATTLTIPEDATPDRCLVAFDYHH